MVSTKQKHWKRLQPFLPNCLTKAIPWVLWRRENGLIFNYFGPIFEKETIVYENWVQGQKYVLNDRNLMILGVLIHSQLVKKL